MRIVGKKGCVWFDSGWKAQRISIFRGLIKSVPSFIFLIFFSDRDNGETTNSFSRLEFVYFFVAIEKKKIYLNRASSLQLFKQ